MDCIQRCFFGVPIIQEAPPDLAAVWGGFRSDPGLLFFARRRFLWRLVRNSSLRRALQDKVAAVIPVGTAARRQVRLATGCDVGEFSPFQGLIRILSHAENDRASVFIVDCNPEAVRRIEDNIRVTFPGLHIVGRAALYPGMGPAVTTAIRKASPRIVLVGSSRRKVLDWALAQYHEVGNALAIIATEGVGRMVGRRPAIPILDILFTPFRTVVPVVLLVHRLVIRRRRKKRQA